MGYEHLPWFGLIWYRFRPRRRCAWHDHWLGALHRYLESAYCLSPGFKALSATPHRHGKRRIETLLKYDFLLPEVVEREIFWRSASSRNCCIFMPGMTCRNVSRSSWSTISPWTAWPLKTEGAMLKTPGSPSNGT